MDKLIKNIATNETSVSKGLTFKDIFNYIKTALPVMLVTMIFGILVSGAVTAIVNEASNKDFFALGVIELSFDGIDEGENPDGTTFNSSNIKSAVNISNALDNLGYDYELDQIRNNMRVDGLIPNEVTQMIEEVLSKDNPSADDLDSLNYFPTKFNVILNYEAIPELNINDANAIVDEVINVFLTKFETIYQRNELFDTTIISDVRLKNNEFFYTYDIMVTSIDNAINVLESYHNSSPQFSSASGKTFIQQRDLLLEQKTYLEKAMFQVTNEGIIKDNKDYTLSELQNQIDNNESLILINKGLIEDKRELLSSFADQFPTIGGGTGDTNWSGDPIYAAAWSSLLDLEDSNAVIERRNLTLVKTKADLEKNHSPDTNESLVNEMEAEFIKIRDTTREIFADSGELFLEFNSNISNKVLNNSSGILIKDQTGYIVPILLGALLSLLLGLAIAPVVNKKIFKMKTAKAANANPKDVPSNKDEKSDNN